MKDLILVKAEKKANFILVPKKFLSALFYFLSLAKLLPILIRINFPIFQPTLFLLKDFNLLNKKFRG
jgi:hypothetical protein